MLMGFLKLEKTAKSRIIWRRPVILIISSDAPLYDKRALYWLSEEKALIRNFAKKAARRHQVHVEVKILDNPQDGEEVNQCIQRLRGRLLYVHYIGHSRQRLALGHATGQEDAVAIPELELDFGSYQPLREKLLALQENTKRLKQLPFQGVFLHSCYSHLEFLTESQPFPEITTQRAIFDHEGYQVAHDFYQALLLQKHTVAEAFANAMQARATRQSSNLTTDFSVTSQSSQRVFSAVSQQEMHKNASLAATQANKLYQLHAPKNWQFHRLKPTLWLKPIVAYLVAALCCLTLFLFAEALWQRTRQQMNFFQQRNQNDTDIIFTLHDSVCSQFNQQVLGSAKYILATFVTDAAYYVDAHLAFMPWFLHTRTPLELKCGIKALDFASLAAFARQKGAEMLAILQIRDVSNCQQKSERGLRIKAFFYVAPSVPGAEFFSTESAFNTLLGEAIELRVPCSMKQTEFNQQLLEAFKLQAQITFEPLAQFLMQARAFELALNNHPEGKAKYSNPKRQTIQLYHILQNMLYIFSNYQLKIILQEQRSRQYQPVDSSAMPHFEYYISGFANQYLIEGQPDKYIDCGIGAHYTIERRLISDCSKMILAGLMQRYPDFSRLELGHSNEHIAHTVQQLIRAQHDRSIHSNVAAEEPESSLKQQNQQANYIQAEMQACQAFRQAIEILEQLIDAPTTPTAIRYKAMYNIMYWHYRFTPRNTVEIENSPKPREYLPCVTEEYKGSARILQQDITVRYQQFIDWLESISAAYLQEPDTFVSSQSAIRVYEYTAFYYSQLRQKEEAIATAQQALQLIEQLQLQSKDTTGQDFLALKWASIHLSLAQYHFSNNRCDNDNPQARYHLAHIRHVSHTRLRREANILFAEIEKHSRCCGKRCYR